MNNHFNKIKSYLIDFGMQITKENEAESIIVVNHESEGIKNLVLAIADPILIMEQFLFEVKHDAADMYKSLLKKNRDIIHGAFVLDDSGKKVLFRDTLQVENLDKNELEASINALSLLLSEYSDELIDFSKY